MFHFFITFLLVLLPVKASQAMEVMVCTQMWCNEGLHVELKNEKWDAGDYTFIVKADDKTVTCTAKLPFNGCDESITCDGDGVMIGASGCALPPETHGFPEVIVIEPPARVGVTIQRGDGKSFTFDSDVEKQCGFPNGEQCDIRECCSAQVSTEVSFK